MRFKLQEMLFYRNEYLWDECSRSDEVKAALANLIDAINEVETRLDQRNQREKFLDDSIREISPVRHTVKNHGLPVLNVLEPRRRRAVKPSEVHRLLARDADLLGRFTWPLWITSLRAEERPLCEHFFDLIEETDQYNHWDSLRRRDERELNTENYAIISTARHAQNAFKRLQWPIEIEICGTTIYWAYSGDDVSFCEEKAIIEQFEAAAETALCVFLPQEVETFAPLPDQVGVVDRSIKRGIVMLHSTKAKIAARYGRLQ